MNNKLFLSAAAGALLLAAGCGDRQMRGRDMPEEGTAFGRYEEGGLVRPEATRPASFRVEAETWTVPESSMGPVREALLRFDPRPAKGTADRDLDRHGIVLAAGMPGLLTELRNALASAPGAQKSEARETRVPAAATASIEVGRPIEGPVSIAGIEGGTPVANAAGFLEITPADSRGGVKRARIVPGVSYTAYTAGSKERRAAPLAREGLRAEAHRPVSANTPVVLYSDAEPGDTFAGRFLVRDTPGGRVRVVLILRLLAERPADSVAD